MDISLLDGSSKVHPIVIVPPSLMPLVSQVKIVLFLILGEEDDLQLLLLPVLLGLDVLDGNQHLIAPIKRGLEQKGSGEVEGC